MFQNIVHVALWKFVEIDRKNIAAFTHHWQTKPSSYPAFCLHCTMKIVYWRETSLFGKYRKAKILYLVSTKKYLHQSTIKGLVSHVTSCFILPIERRKTLDQQFYHIGQFARKASVSIRTLRY